jgi:chromosome segregation ATPase
MGYALFTARKLSVSTRLNTCNSQLASNTERAYTLTSSIFAKQSQSALDSSVASQNAYKAYEAVITQDGVTEEQKTAADSTLKKALADAEVKSAQTNTEIQALNLDQTRLDQEKKRLETQLNAYQNELDGVEKAEETAIKNAAPKY